MNAEEFYKSFRHTFSSEKFKKVREDYAKEGWVEPLEWTKLMKAVLESVALDSGFHRCEEQKISNGRVDEKWQEGEYSIFIEHENYATVEDLMNKEVKNLLNSDGNLRILITYFDEKDVEKETQLKFNILNKLKSEKKGRYFEFLLIIGKYGMTSSDDYKAYLYRPTFECESINREAEVN